MYNFMNNLPLNNISIWFNLMNNSNIIINNLVESIEWNKSMKSRYTVSYGKKYIYSNDETTSEIPTILKDLKNKVDNIIGYTNNNILINYYFEGNSKMGFHSDDLNQLTENTGVLIYSLGDPRVIRFKNKIDKNKTFDITLYNDSLFFMSNEIQEEWLHSILPSNDNNNKRISITFRRLK